MLNKILSRTPLHEHADPAQRVLGVAELPPDSAELVQLLRADPAPEVRARLRVTQARSLENSRIENRIWTRFRTGQ